MNIFSKEYIKIGRRGLLDKVKSFRLLVFYASKKNCEWMLICPKIWLEKWLLIVGTDKCNQSEITRGSAPRASGRGEKQRAAWDRVPASESPPSAPVPPPCGGCLLGSIFSPRNTRSLSIS